MTFAGLPVNGLILELCNSTYNRGTKKLFSGGNRVFRSYTCLNQLIVSIFNNVLQFFTAILENQNKALIEELKSLKELYTGQKS